MIRDLSESCPANLPDYDVCIVGSGPAGGTLANELSGHGLSVCVLESGRRKTDRHGDALRDVVSEGLSIKEYSRERVLGGASTTWAGLSSPLDPIDFAERPWVEHGGWPITRAELEPYWVEAERYRFPAASKFAPAPDGFARLRAKGDLEPRFEALDEKVFLAAAEPQDFGVEVLAAYEEKGVDLWLDATVTALETGGDRRRVRAARVRTRSGEERTVSAGRFVLACGGIENARLLLATPGGLGNERDQVGRYFMNHPKNYEGVLTLESSVRHAPYWFGCLHEGYAGYAGLRFNEAEQTARRLLNSYVRFEPLFPWSDNLGVEAMVLLAKRSGAVLRRFKSSRSDEVVELRDYSETGDDSDVQNQRKSWLEWGGLLGSIAANAVPVARYARSRLFDRGGPNVTRVRLRNFLEMEPRPENRVTLDGSGGAPRARVSHRLSDLDRRSLVELHEVLVSEFDRAGLGRLDSDLATRTPWPIDQDASHHLGATRMGRDPATSVVDADLRLHEMDNVFVAGGSVFPTAGCANPTYTIVALSIRLARHLMNEETR